jgi:hypothetical protein
MRPPLQPKHVPPERVWSFIYDQIELSETEQRHLNVCVHCAEIFKLCVISDSFDRMMREIAVGHEDLLAA